MPFINDRDRKALIDLFAQRLTDNVNIVYFTQHDSTLSVPALECEYCEHTRDLLEELASLSGKLRLSVYDFVGQSSEAESRAISRIPAIAIEGKAKGRVRFYGVPAGYEFATIVEDLVDVANGTTDLSAATRESLKSLDRDVHIQVFVTPT